MRPSQRNRHDPFPKKQWREYADQPTAKANQPFKDFVSRCNKRAKDISLKAQISTPAYDDDFWDDEEYYYDDAKPHWMRRIVALFILLPLSIIFLRSLYDQLVFADDKWGILLSVPVWYTLLGGLAWLILAGSKLFGTSLLFLYVLGHELTHAIAVLLSFGKVSGFKVALEGGHVKTNKNNIFIALSPYFIPLWAIIWAGLYALINIYYPLDQFQGVLYGGIGFWWVFHLFWTAWLIPRDQPDLKENDTLFSLMIIYLANMLLLAFMLVLCEIINIKAFALDFAANTKQFWFALCDFANIFY